MKEFAVRELTLGQVDHVHWHLIPRFPDDGLAPWKQGAYGSPDAMRIMAEAIRNNIRA